MRILVVGAGAVGGYFGGRLAEVGADIAFAVRPERLAEYERTGLSIVSPLGDVALSPKFVAVPDVPFVADIVVLACKAHGLMEAAEVATRAMDPRSRILPLLNGVDHLDTLNALFGRDRVLGGLAHIGATIGAKGEVHHLNTLNIIRFGTQDGKQDDACCQLEAAFTGTPVASGQSAVILQEMWDKFVFVATLAGVTCLMRASVGVIASAQGGGGFISAMLDEATAIATAEGHAPDAEQLSTYRTQLLDPASRSTSSMLRDTLRGARTEADHILASMTRRATRHGLSVPTLSTAWLHLQAYEAQRAG